MSKHVVKSTQAHAGVLDSWSCTRKSTCNDSGSMIALRGCFSLVRDGGRWYKTSSGSEITTDVTRKGTVPKPVIKVLVQRIQCNTVPVVVSWELLGVVGSCWGGAARGTKQRWSQNERRKKNQKTKSTMKKRRRRQEKKKKNYSLSMFKCVQMFQIQTFQHGCICGANHGSSSRERRQRCNVSLVLFVRCYWIHGQRRAQALSG